MSELDWIDKDEFNKEPEKELPDTLDELVEQLDELPEKDFKDLYGFEHDCHCASDWKDGNTGMVSMCYTEMCDDALKRCHEYKGEVAHLKRKIGVLRDQVRAKGEEPSV